MTIEVSWPAVSAGCTVLGLVGGAIGKIIANAFEARDSKIKGLEDALPIATAALRRDFDQELERMEKAHEHVVEGLRSSIKLLFEKNDARALELQNYKLHVAENYVGMSALKDMLAPIVLQLREIEKDLRERKKGD